jgi:HEAT repeat protein
MAGRRTGEFSRSAKQLASVRVDGRAHMKHLSNAALFDKLKSPEIMDRVFAAEELGARREPTAVPPLLAALTKINSEYDDGLMHADALIDALAAIGDRVAIPAIFRMLRLGRGVMDERGETPVSAAACAALVALRATEVLPQLRALQAGRTACDYGGQVARVIVELGGAGEAELFVKLLRDADPVTRMAAAEALGRLWHLPACPALEAMLADRDPSLRLAALGALLAMEQPGAEARLRAEMLQASTTEEREAICTMLHQQSRQAQVGVLLELADDPRWADSPITFFHTLELAVRLGSPVAVSRLQELVEDPETSGCARVRAAGILLGNGEQTLLPLCLEFLRGFRAEPEGSNDPGDDAGSDEGDDVGGDAGSDEGSAGGHAALCSRRGASRQYVHDTEREVLAAVREHARKHREARLQVADVLALLVERDDDTADDLDGLISYLAAGALLGLTGSWCTSELTQWRADQQASG